MESSSLWIGVAEALRIIKEHSANHKPPKHTPTKLERLSGWAILLGGVIVVVGEAIRQMGDPKVPSVLHAYASISILGLIFFAVGAVVSVIEVVRSMRHPLAEHIDRITEAAGPEGKLFAALQPFEPVVLELTCERLMLESKKVSSRLAIIGGGDGLRTSMVGVALLGAALVSKYEAVIHGWTMKVLAFFGTVFLLGLSIGALHSRYGASRAEYYCDFIKLVLLVKSRVTKKPRETFSSRVRRGRLSRSSING
ncbi:MAG TPA: hypothetical protein VIU34_08270 [Steroidobacter sp.]